MTQPPTHTEPSTVSQGGQRTGRHTGGHRRQPSSLDDLIRPISVYNFRRPRLFTVEQLRVLNDVHERFARSLAVQLSAQLRSIVDIGFSGAEQVLFSEYKATSTAPSAHYAIEMQGAVHKMLVEVDPRFAIFMVEKLFGGTGTFVATRRPMSRIEQRIFSNILNKILSELEKAWDRVHQVNLRECGFEPDIEFVEIVQGAEPVLVATLDVTIYDQTTQFNICYPSTQLEQLLSRDGLKRFASSTASDAEPRMQEQFRAAISSVQVELRSELGRASVNMQDMLQLAVGDIVLLNKTHADPVEIYVDDRLKFTASPGRVGKKRAVRIVAADDD